MIPWRIAENFFDYPGEFTPYDPANTSNQIVAYPSYVWSPSAMYHPDVSGKCGFRQPGSFPAGYKSPAVGQCKYPDLKTRMVEHHWLQNNESEANPSFGGNDPSWLFTQGYNSSPVCLFFDGHVGVKGVREAMDADKRAEALFNTNNVCSQECPSGSSCEPGLWNRGMASFFGHGQGYGGQYSYDTLVNTGMHMYTTGGITGRDMLSNEGN